VIRCLKFHPCAQNTLIGLADLELTRTGLVFRGCPVHAKGSRQWVSFPARSYEDASGVKRWQAIIEFAPDASRELFQRLAVEAVNAYGEQNAEEVS
jgi:hypothetical protein